MAKPKNPSMNLASMANAIHGMEGSLGRDAAGNGNYGMAHDTMMPTEGTLPTIGKKPQTPLQHDAVKKAAAASVAKRRVAAGLSAATPLSIAPPSVKKRLPRI